MNENGNSPSLDGYLPSGVDIGPDGRVWDASKWEDLCAKKRWESLLADLPAARKHDIETWESFHLDEDGGIKKLKKKVEAGETIFELSYFGGIQARHK